MLKNKKIILNCLASLAIFLFFVLPALTLAQGTDGGDGGGAPSGGTIEIELKNPFRGDDIPSFIRTVVNEIFMPIGGLVAVAMIIYAGFLYVTAAGDPGKIKKAHDALLYGVIGAAILLGAWVISEAIQGTINDLRK